MGKKYYCSKCEHYHYRGKVYENHQKYKSENPSEDNKESKTGEESAMSVKTESKKNVEDSTGLRNINLSGGFFTENIILRLRDNPENLDIGKISSFLEKDTREERKKCKEKRRELFEWCRDKWDSISPKLDDWSGDDIIQKWLLPFFSQLGYNLEEFELKEENIDPESPLASFRINFQEGGHKNPFFQLIDINEDFESKVNINGQRSAHHQICQQFINRNPDIKWLFLSNGRILRILTEYYHTYSKGYVEFDLENIFANRDVKEFNVMYSMIHPTRFQIGVEDHAFLIDEFKKESIQEGVKVGDNLRDNVHDALELLGNELIQQNSHFLDIVLSDGIDLMEYYAQLLRIIYRIIFILYAEQREMLPGAGTTYFDHFSFSSLRMIAEKPIKIEKNYDQWNKLFLTFKLVGKGNELLGINSYDGALFDDKKLSLILENDLKISNSTLLKIIRLLTTTESNNFRQRINFLEIREEEIGAVYESLLDYKPYINDNSQFQLIHQTTERKSTGSYYTPKELIDILIRTTLQPLVEDRLSEADDKVEKKENALLDIKVCDPACGGGTFLLSALDFLGKKLAEVRTDSESPLENDLRIARRDILQHCIYGVDKNPLVVELSKISLWLRATVKDKPLNFLDNHIKCGNSLIGLGQKQNIEKIRPKAFRAIKGNKSTGITAENKKLQNKARDIIRDEIKERKKEGQTTMITSFLTQKRTADICSAKFQQLIDMSEDNPNKIKEKQEKYEKLKKNSQYKQALDQANIWTSTYFWPFEGNVLNEIPSYTIIEQLREGKTEIRTNKLTKKIDKIAIKNNFFHWYIEFPEVFSSERRGFDCILTNPPWETLQLKEMEFFAGIDNEILNAPNQSERRKLIKKLKNEDSKLFEKFKDAWQAMKKMSHYLRNSGLFDLSAQGTINTYALFVERCWRIISPKGYTGIVCPTGVVMNYYMQDLFRTLVKERSILSMFDFINNKGIFDIHRDYRFCLLSLGGKNISKEIIPMTFFTQIPKDIQESLSIILENGKNIKEKLNDLPNNHQLIPLEPGDFELFNPNTITCPSFRSRKDFELTRHLYNQTEIFIERDYKSNEIISNPWSISLQRLFESKDGITEDTLRSLEAKPKSEKSNGGVWIDKNKNKYYPLYEGRMIWHYDHRLNSMGFAEQGKKRKAISIKTNLEQYKNPQYYVSPLYWVKEEIIRSKIPESYNFNWFLGLRKITGATNERTMVSTIFPWSALSDSIVTLLFTELNFEKRKIACLLANLNSIVFDYVVKQKFSGNNLNNYIIEQFPVFSPKKYNNYLMEEIVKRVVELVYTSYDLEKFANDCDYFQKPFNWNYEKRAQVQAELDAIYAHLYNISRSDLEYIINFFSVLRENELEDFNEYRTKRLVLKAYDKFSKQKELFE